MIRALPILFLCACLTASGQPMPPTNTVRLASLVPQQRVVRTNITVTWDHVNLGEPWLRFNLYSTTNILIPLKQWPKTQLATNIITVNIDKQNWFCTVTALNIDTGVESDYATKDKP